MVSSISTTIFFLLPLLTAATHNMTFASPHIRASQLSTPIQNPYYTFTVRHVSSDPVYIHRQPTNSTSEQQQQLIHLPSIFTSGTYPSFDAGSLFYDTPPVAPTPPDNAIEIALDQSDDCASGEFDLAGITVEFEKERGLKLWVVASTGQWGNVDIAPPWDWSREIGGSTDSANSVGSDVVVKGDQGLSTRRRRGRRGVVIEKRDSRMEKRQNVERDVGDGEKKRMVLKPVGARYGMGDSLGIGWKRVRWVKIWAGYAMRDGEWWSGLVGDEEAPKWWGLDDVLLRKRCAV
ncbi:hypothetical protein EX30DRAFT_338371 [Ascodesmis nigricans]|uniref:Uncharacterized protein n=1 Tax=Ascodesmis nigricans TaxID=341454 RepID=A0A4S2N3F5_9PEZI|nr:hypothetical protein EX30DRAFT_338371 [Ascodesmis nigricans]